MPQSRRPLIVIASIALLLSACSSVGGSAESSTSPSAFPASMSPPTPSSVPSSTPAPPVPSPSDVAPSPTLAVSHVGSASQAAALVFASNPLFDSIVPGSATQAGPTSSYTASDETNGYVVIVTMGSSDCQANCSTNHTWNYEVTASGKVTLTSEQGPPVQPSADHGTLDPATVNVLLVAGPVCPVERIPPDPNCAPRPVPHVTVVLRDSAGNEVGRGTADDYGVVTFSVPAGAYYVEPGNVGGMMQAPNPTAFSVLGGKNIKVTLMYDTGIR